MGTVRKRQQFIVNGLKMVSNKQTRKGTTTMNCYHHLSMEERESLLIGVQNQKSLWQIATKLGRSPMDP